MKREIVFPVEQGKYAVAGRAIKGTTRSVAANISRRGRQEAAVLAVKADAKRAGITLSNNRDIADAANKRLLNPKDHLTVDSALFRTNRP